MRHQLQCARCRRWFVAGLCSGVLLVILNALLIDSLR